MLALTLSSIRCADTTAQLSQTKLFLTGKLKTEKPPKTTVNEI